MAIAKCWRNTTGEREHEQGWLGPTLLLSNALLGVMEQMLQ